MQCKEQLAAMRDLAEHLPLDVVSGCGNGGSPSVNIDASKVKHPDVTCVHGHPSRHKTSPLFVLRREIFMAS